MESKTTKKNRETLREAFESDSFRPQQLKQNPKTKLLHVSEKVFRKLMKKALKKDLTCDQLAEKILTKKLHH